MQICHSDRHSHSTHLNQPLADTESRDHICFDSVFTLDSPVLPVLFYPVTFHETIHSEMYENDIRNTV